MRILLTGANGFIGKNIMDDFKEFDIIPFSLKNNPVSDIDFSDIDIVIHLAALVHQMKGAPDVEYFRINSDLTFELANAAKNNGVKQFIFMSTVKVFGEGTKEGQPWNEYSECKPTDSYGKSKLEAENRINTLADKDFHISVIRTPLVYGPGVKGNMLSLIALVKSYKIIPLGGIKNKRTMVYLGNLLSLIKKIIEKNVSGIYIAGDAASLSTSEMVVFISKALCKKRILIKIPLFLIKILAKFKPNIMERLYGSLELDCNVTNTKLDHIPPYSIYTGVFEMVKSYKSENR